MKRLLLMVIAFVCLTACGRQEQEDFGNAYDPDKDAQTFSGLRDTVFTEQGFYTIDQMDEMERIVFVERETGKSVPVCAKLNCTHNDESCNAYFEIPSEIHVYDGMLYVVADGSEGPDSKSLYRFSMDGSEKVELKTLFSYEEEEDAAVTLDFVIHRGYGYMVTNWIEKDRKERTQTLYRISLDEDTEKEKLYEIKGYSPLIFITQAEKNRLYFTTRRYLDQDLKEEETGNFYLDLSEGTITELDVPNGYGLVAAKNGKVYYYKFDEKAIHRMNEDGTGQEKVFEWEYDQMIIYEDEKYLYMSNEMLEEEQKLVVTDYEGNLVREFTDMENKALLWSNGEQILVWRVDSDSDGREYELMDIKE